MTDKVQKIREEVERLKSLIGNNSFLSDYEKGCNDGREDMCDDLISFINSLQEEPVSNPIDFEKELYKAFGQVKDFTLGMQIAKWFYDMGKNSQEPVSEFLNKESMIESYKQRLISQANGVKNSPFIDMCLVSYKHGINETLDTLKLSNFARIGKNWKEEPVSEELEEELSKLLKECEVDAEYVHQDFLHIVARHFANWQKKQFEKDYADLCNGIVTAKGIAVAMAYDNGVADAKKQMMANAIDVTVHIDAGGYPYTPEIELYDYDKDVPLAKEGDKYKVVLIKEE